MQSFNELSELLNNALADVRAGRIPTRDGFTCRECWGSGFRRAPDPQDPRGERGYTGVVRCGHCRYWEFRQGVR